MSPVDSQDHNKIPKVVVAVKIRIYYKLPTNQNKNFERHFFLDEIKVG